jgi:hypothetical protein
MLNYLDIIDMYEEFNPYIHLVGYPNETLFHKNSNSLEMLSLSYFESYCIPTCFIVGIDYRKLDNKIALIKREFVLNKDLIIGACIGIALNITDYEISKARIVLRDKFNELLKSTNPGEYF